ncbi:MAG: hypothetical protein ACOYK9_00135 [Chlamydiia bacterium]
MLKLKEFFPKDYDTESLIPVLENLASRYKSFLETFHSLETKEAEQMALSHAATRAHNTREGHKILLQTSAISALFFGLFMLHAHSNGKKEESTPAPITAIKEELPTPLEENGESLKAEVTTAPISKIEETDSSK